MNRLLRLPSAYFALPILLACATTPITFDLPEAYLPGILLLAAVAFCILLIDVLSGLRLPELRLFRLRDYAGTREAFLALALAALIVLFCVLDLALFPVPLFSGPTSYADMQGGREHVRHVSDMCWVLPPIAMLCVRHRGLRSLLIATGLLFPVLVIDRNRLFASVFCVVLVMALRRNEEKPLPWRRIFALVVAGCAAFSLLGMLRSGSFAATTLPFSAVFHVAPEAVKWLLVYASAGPYNFGSMLAKGYYNADFLYHQLVPMTGSVATAGTDIPLDASNINVGTEFFPFLLAFGPLGAVASMAALYAMLRWSVRRLRGAVSLFAFLIFLRVAYVCVMSPFAPQAFTLTNFGFIAVCLFLQLLSAWLPNGRKLALASARNPTIEGS
jgi:oligosaccharide repeat unit polymerase